MCTSELAFITALDAGALPLVTNLTQDSSDVLLQLNALELLEKARRGKGHVREIPFTRARSIGCRTESRAPVTAVGAAGSFFFFCCRPYAFAMRYEYLAHWTSLSHEFGVGRWPLFPVADSGEPFNLTAVCWDCPGRWPPQQPVRDTLSQVGT